MYFIDPNLGSYAVAELKAKYKISINYQKEASEFRYTKQTRARCVEGSQFCKMEG